MHIRSLEREINELKDSIVIKEDSADRIIQHYNEASERFKDENQELQTEVSALRNETNALRHQLTLLKTEADRSNGMSQTYLKTLQYISTLHQNMNVYLQSVGITPPPHIQ